ncbi:vomeronasal type-2 receptor 26-like [Pogona vitticeps]
MMNDKIPGLSFYQMVPQEDLQYRGILSLLLHFRWTWIGSVVMDTDNGERFIQIGLPLFTQDGICFAFIEKIPKFSFVSDVSNMLLQGAKIFDKIMDSKANVILAYGESYSIALFRWFPYLSEQEHMTQKGKGKVWIMTAQMEFTSFTFQRNWETDFLHGSLSFKIHSNDIPGFRQFAENRKPLCTNKDGFMRDFWQQAFGCVFPNIAENARDAVDICTGEEKLESLPGAFFQMSMTSHSYSIYNAIYAVAQALQQAMSTAALGHKVMGNRAGLKLQHQQFWQVMSYVYSIDRPPTLDVIDFHRCTVAFIFFPAGSYDEIIPVLVHLYIFYLYGL